MFELPNLEIHAWHGCNLRCESCSHYSSLGLRGGPSPEECESWMAAWANRLRPRLFSILGGEPTLNPGLARIVAIAGRLWPRSRIRVVTNGFLLSNHPDLPAVMEALPGRCFLEVSSHHPSQTFQEAFAPVRRVVADWLRKYRIDVRIVNADQRWTRRYTSADGRIDFLGTADTARTAWQICEGKKCKQLYQGLLWKCPPVAYFGLMVRTVSVEQRWRQLVSRYAPLDPRSTDADLLRFLGREDEDVCSLCPAHLERFSLPNPLPSNLGALLPVHDAAHAR
jgi:hypothetical protein